MLVSYLCGVFLLAKKCDWRPTRVQEYLGILCDSGTATLRVPQEKLDVVHTLLTEALENRTVAFQTSQQIAGKVTSMTVAIRPASLYTQVMFAALAMLDKATQRTVDLSLDPSANLVGEMKQLARHLRHYPRGAVAAGKTFYRRPHEGGIGRFLGSVGRRDAHGRRPV